MAFNILTTDVKQQLEQERSRLMNQRQAVIDEAVKQATLEIDQMLDHLNGLLDGAPAATAASTDQTGMNGAVADKPAPTNGRKTRAKVAPQKGKAKGAAGRKSAAPAEAPEPKAAEAPAESPVSKATGPRSVFTRGKKTGAAAGKSTEKRPRIARTPGKTQIPGKKFDLENLKREYKKIPLIDAIAQAMAKAPEQIYGIDDLIGTLFTKVDPEEMSLARRDLGLVVARAVKAGTLEKVQDKPSRYKLKS